MTYRIRGVAIRHTSPGASPARVTARQPSAAESGLLLERLCTTQRGDSV